MKLRKYRLFASGVALLLLVGIFSACGLLREPAEPSAPIEAIPLAPTTAAMPGLATVVPQSTEEGPAATATAPALPGAEGAELPAYPAAESAAESPPVAEAASIVEAYPADTGDTALVYRIDPGASQVRFELNEELRGVPTTVVGTTDQVAGELSVNLSDLSTAQVGTLQINARTLLTDNNFRNRAIQNQILETNEFEFITFTPTAVNGLPPTAQLGEIVSFVINGELTIRDITRPVEFTVEATPLTDTQLSGTAQTTINRTDFDLRIPSAPGIANVEEEVELYIDFLANAS